MECTWSRQWVDWCFCPCAVVLQPTACIYKLITFIKFVPVFLPFWHHFGAILAACGHQGATLRQARQKIAHGASICGDCGSNWHPAGSSLGTLGGPKLPAKQPKEHQKWRQRGFATSFKRESDLETFSGAPSELPLAREHSF